jgi:hypothetical protein
MIHDNGQFHFKISYWIKKNNCFDVFYLQATNQLAIAWDRVKKKGHAYLHEPILNQGIAIAHISARIHLAIA